MSKKIFKLSFPIFQKCQKPKGMIHFLVSFSVFTKKKHLNWIVPLCLFVLGNLMTRHHTVEMSEQYRDLLAKTIYGRLFSYLVNCINDYLHGHDDGPG